ncbi:MAG TPA: DUF58 domain-containing protein [Archaeoglobus veneficus]|nr:DUF58 domain-containing protein [Archaeoglobus veneficus]
MRKAAVNLAKTALFLAVLGILFTSVELLALSIIPLFFLIIPFGAKLRVVKSDFSNQTVVGGEFYVDISIKASGFGRVKVRHNLPEHFEVVEGENIANAFVAGSKVVRISYRAIATKRGVYNLDRIDYEVESPLSTFVKRGKLHAEISIEVKHRVPKIRKVGNVRGKARSPMPDIDVARIGVPGTDFREIREYMPGDAMKFVNWKATARKGKLMVNQYEVEGKKAIWIFVDSNPYMLHGTTIKNYLEAAIEVANALAYYYTSRNHKVGLYVIGERRLLHPDVGSRQFRRISKALIEVVGGVENVSDAIQACKNLIMFYKPLVILITRVERAKLDGVVKLARFLPVQVIALKGLESGFSGSIFDTLRRSCVSKLRSCGQCIEFDVNRQTSSLFIV